MRNIRLIARLDVKAPNLVKSVQMEGLRKLGNPNDFAKKYYSQGIDEICYVDIVASLYDRNSLLDIIRETTDNVFVPITVEGGIRTVVQVEAALRAGADKVAINTAAIKNPELIDQVARRFGSQCMVVSIQAKRNEKGFEAYFDNGREHSHKNAVEWAIEAESRGAGEILLTSVDKEGTAKGFDIELVEEVTSRVSIPVIASGGMGQLGHFEEVVNKGGADAVAMAHVLHYEHLDVKQIRDYAIEQNIPVRKVHV